MSYEGTIIEESLEDKSVLKEMKILSQKIHPVTEKDQTPWVKQWTLDKVEISEEVAEEIAEKISKSLDSKHQHAWYVDYRNKNIHFIIFLRKVFKVARTSQAEYNAAIQYGINIGMPDYQIRPVAKYLSII